MNGRDICYLPNKYLKESNDNSNQQNFWNVHYFCNHYILYISLIAVCALYLFAASDILNLQPKIGLVFASSPQGEDDEDDSISQNDTDISSSLSSTTAIKRNDILLYENSSYGVSVVYPSNWDQFQPISDPESRTILIAQFEPANINGTVLFTVSRDTPSFNGTLDSYLAETVQSYRGNTLNFTLISTEISPDTTTYPLLAGNPAYSLLFTHTDPDSDARLLTQEIGTIISETNMVYYISYTADIPSYDQYIDDALSIADSLEIHLTGLNIIESEWTDIINSLESLESGEI